MPMMMSRGLISIIDTFFITICLMHVVILYTINFWSLIVIARLNNMRSGDLRFISTKHDLLPWKNS